MKRKASPPVTPQMAAEIRFLRQSKGLYNHQIAALFGINQGRVSEVLTGKRFPDVPPAQGSLFN
jgi:transcriptional regulator with XRE-family HTH domain